MPAHAAQPLFQQSVQQNAREDLDLRWVFGVSVLLSLWLIYIDPLVNRDGIIYLRAAEAYLQDGFAASHAIFGRPLLSITMGVLHQLTGLSLIHCGQAITTLSYALFCTGFVAVIRICPESCAFSVSFFACCQ